MSGVAEASSETEAKKLELNNLPEIILLNIFENFDYFNILRVASVNHNFRGIVERNRALRSVKRPIKLILNNYDSYADDEDFLHVSAFSLNSSYKEIGRLDYPFACREYASEEIHPQAQLNDPMMTTKFQLDYLVRNFHIYKIELRENFDVDSLNYVIKTNLTCDKLFICNEAQVKDDQSLSVLAQLKLKNLVITKESDGCANAEKSTRFMRFLWRQKWLDQIDSLDMPTTSTDLILPLIYCPINMIFENHLQPADLAAIVQQWYNGNREIGYLQFETTETDVRKVVGEWFETVDLTPEHEYVTIKNILGRALIFHLDEIVEEGLRSMWIGPEKKILPKIYNNSNIMRMKRKMSESEDPYEDDEEGIVQKKLRQI